MNGKKQYCGLDLLKFIMAILVAARHMIQVFYPAESRWRLVIGSWLSNLAVPVFLHHCRFPAVSQDPGYRQEERMAGGGTLCLAHCEAVSALVRDLLAYRYFQLVSWTAALAGDREGILSIPSFSRVPLPSCGIFRRWQWRSFWSGPLTGRAGRAAAAGADRALFVFGCICDNWYFTERAPMKIQEFVWWYAPKFVTMRNGLFYGSFYLTLGLWFSRKTWRMPVLLSLGAVWCF